MSVADIPEGATFDDVCNAFDSPLAELGGRLNAVNAGLVELTEQLLETGAWKQGGMRTPEAFLAWKLGVSPHRAETIVAAARERRHRPVIMGLFDEARLSLEQVTETLKAPRWADELVADIAQISTVAKLRRAMRSENFEGDPDEPDPEPEPVRDRLSFGIGRNGRWRISGELSPDDGLRIEAAINERKDALFDAGNEKTTYPEAFVDCFDRSLGAVESVSRRDHFRTWFHIDVTDGHTITTDGWFIPPELRDLILCDGVVHPVWERDGIPFSVGRSQRIVPDRTRRIVELRDRGCRVPGCTGTHVEIHHLPPDPTLRPERYEGGTTDTWNLISLCRFHHKLHHQGELGISGNADDFDGIVMTDQRGERIAGVGSPAAPTDIPEPVQRYRPPLNGRFDWNWIGLGWIHPKAVEQQQAKMAEHWARVDREARAA